MTDLERIKKDVVEMDSRANVRWYDTKVLTKAVRLILEELAADRKDNYSEKPNNCEHITEDGVTCAKYPACDDCPDNPLNKVKGSERLVKGSEQTEPTISKMEQVDEPQTCDTCKYGEDKHRYAHICNECGVGINNYEPKDEPTTQMKTQNSNLTFEKADEPQTGEMMTEEEFDSMLARVLTGNNEPQTDCDKCQHRYDGTTEFCRTCGASNFQPKDEPQTEEWYTFQDEQEYNARHGKE